MWVGSAVTEGQIQSIKRLNLESSYGGGGGQ